MLYHRHGSNHRINREYRIQHQNLQHHAPKRRKVFYLPHIGKLGMAFQSLVQLSGGFVEQKQATKKHNQVFAGNRKFAHEKQRMSEGDDVRHQAQHNDADDYRQAQPHQTGAITVLGFDFIGQNGNEHQVIDAQHHLQHQQGCKAYPCGRLGQPAEIHGFIPLYKTKTGSLSISQAA